MISVSSNTIYSFKNNIALRAVSIDPSFPINTYTLSNGAAMVDLKFLCSIKNDGATTINSFYITANRGSFSGDPCYRNFIHKQYYNLTVLPGDSVLVATDAVYGLLQSAYFPNYVTLNNICFVASMPNQETDNVLLNNINCPALSLNATGTSENTSGNNNIRIYPNPVASTLNIEIDEGYSDIFLFNCLGDLCGKYKNLQRLDVSGLNEGLYFLQITLNGKRYDNYKIIIQR
jgi:hypothetical protein